MYLSLTIDYCTTFFRKSHGANGFGCSFWSNVMFVFFYHHRPEHCNVAVNISETALSFESFQREWMGHCEVTVTLTLDHQNIISLSLRPRGHLCQIEEMLSQNTVFTKMGRTDNPANKMPRAMGIAGTEAKQRGFEAYHYSGLETDQSEWLQDKKMSLVFPL